MRQILLFLLLLFSVSIGFPQTTWRGMGGNDNWNNSDNWSTNSVPDASEDVIIPSGFNVNMNFR